MKTKIFACIGNRKTPPQALANMKVVLEKLKADGWEATSGGARFGPDKLAEVVMHDKITIYKPEHATKDAVEMASKYHPAWDKCNEWVRTAHGRNAMIVLGVQLDWPVDFVLCWTPEGKVTGGTGMGIRIAVDHKIPVFNMGDPKWNDEVRKWKESPKSYHQRILDGIVCSERDCQSEDYAHEDPVRLPDYEEDPDVLKRIYY